MNSGYVLSCERNMKVIEIWMKPHKAYQGPMMREGCLICLVRRVQGSRNAGRLFARRIWMAYCFQVNKEAFEAWEEEEVVLLRGILAFVSVDREIQKWAGGLGDGKE